jgi:hypothetical protein
MGPAAWRRRLEADDDVELVALGGEDEDRDARARGPYAAADLEPVDPGKADVQHQQVVVAFDAHPRGLEPVCHRLDPIALARQRAGQRHGDRLVVFCKQQAHDAHARSAAFPESLLCRAARVTGRADTRISWDDRSHVTPAGTPPSTAAIDRVGA